MSPETERAIVALALSRGLVSNEQVDSLSLEARRRASRGRPETIARLLVEKGFIDRAAAASLLQEVRAARARGTGAVAVLEPPSRSIDRGSATASAEVGRELGPYRIVGELGRGGQAAVFRALDTRLGREVALKTITGFGDLEATDRFVREARAAARLRHPGIVQVHDAGVIGAVCFVALELVEGGSLEKRLERGPLLPNEAASLVRDLALAVDAAHAQGIIHRDLKPANVLLEDDGRPRLTDFGLARDERWERLTTKGVALGTPAFMAPEQALAEGVGPVTDVYGLGAVLYSALTASPPFSGPTPIAVLNKVLNENVESPSSRRAKLGLPALARDLETICLKALEKKPDARYPSAEALSRDLRHYLAGEAIEASPPASLDRAARWLRRNRAVALALVAIALSLAFVVAWVVRERARRVEEARVRREEARREAETAGAEVEKILRGSLPPLTPKEILRRSSIIGMATRSLVLAERYAALDPDRGEAFAKRIATAVLKRGVAIGDRDLVFFAAEVLGDSKQAEEAKRIAAEIERSWQSTERALEAYGFLLERNLPVASRIADEVLARDPRSYYANVVAATVAVAEKRHEDALRHLNVAIEVFPGEAVSYHDRSECLEEMGRLEEAEADATRALQLQPGMVAYLILRARIRLQRDGIDAAAEDVNAVLALEPTNAKALCYQGAVLSRKGDFDGARRALAQSLAIDPLDAAPTLELGYVAEAQGKPDEARALFERVVERLPSSRLAASARSRLAALSEKK